MALRCGCTQCVIGGMRGPLVLITLGVLFLVDRWHWGYTFGQLFPLLMIVFGVMKVAEALAPADGHQAG